MENLRHMRSLGRMLIAGTGYWAGVSVGDCVNTRTIGVEFRCVPGFSAYVKLTGIYTYVCLVFIQSTCGQSRFPLYKDF